MNRYVVVGSSGSGKTTLAEVMAERLSIPHIELDAHFHGPNWTQPEPGAFEARVANLVAGDAWVVCGNYSRVRDIVWSRATHVVWLDYPRSLVMRRLIPRTLRRIATRERLWNDNLERWRNLVDPRPEENVILWSWTRHDLQTERYEAAMVDSTWDHLEFIRLRSPAAADRWLSSL